MHQVILELLQQPFDIFELFLCAACFAGAAAKFVENLARPCQVRLVWNLDRAAGHRSGLIQRPAEGIGAFALPVIAIARLLPIRRHDVLGELLGAVAQLIERTLLCLLGVAQLVAGKIVARLAHLAARLVEAARHLHAVARQALDDLVELVAQALLVLR